MNTQRTGDVELCVLIFLLIMEFYTAFFGLVICLILCPNINIIIKTLQKQFPIRPAG